MQGTTDRYNGIFGDHAATMLLQMWQHSTWQSRVFFKVYMNAHGDPGHQCQASDQPKVAGNIVKLFSCSLKDDSQSITQ